PEEMHDRVTVAPGAAGDTIRRLENEAASRGGHGGSLHEMREQGARTTSTLQEPTLPPVFRCWLTPVGRAPAARESASSQLEDQRCFRWCLEGFIEQVLLACGDVDA